MPSYKLRYFEAKGAGEVARLLFAQAGVDYTDERIPREKWPSQKDSTPFGQMPVLEVDGVAYAQSSAITRYLAREFGLYGKTNTDGLEIDQVLGIGQDAFTAYVRARFESNEEKKAELMKELKKTKIPQYLNMYEKILERKTTGYFVGGALTLADVYVFDQCEKLEADFDLSPYPQLQRVRQNVAGQPNIKKWLDKRPVTQF